MVANFCALLYKSDCRCRSGHSGWLRIRYFLHVTVHTEMRKISIHDLKTAIAQKKRPFGRQLLIFTLSVLSYFFNHAIERDKFFGVCVIPRSHSVYTLNFLVSQIGFNYYL